MKARLPADLKLTRYPAVRTEQLDVTPQAHPGDHDVQKHASAINPRSYESDVMSTEPEVLVGAAGMLDEILKGAALRSVFQPIVDLQTGRLFGYEALTRGPGASMLERPDPLFAVARAEGRLAELDAAGQATAVASAERHAIRSPLTLFVNAEPNGAGFGVLPRLGRDVRGIIELTERTLTSRLADLLPAVQAAREQAWGIALDDVGADTRSLALMPLLRPDVIKLDLRLVQDQPTPEIAAIAGAVGAQAERTARPCSPRALRPRSRRSTRGHWERRWDRGSCSVTPPQSWLERELLIFRCRSTVSRCRTRGVRRLNWPARIARFAAGRLGCWRRSAVSSSARRPQAVARRC